MTNLRLTVTLAALACFAAGVGVGLAMPIVAEAWGKPEQPGQHDEYIDSFKKRYGLDADQVRTLRAVLLMYDDQKLSIARDFDHEQWPAEARSQLINAQRLMRKRVEVLLNTEQRDQYRLDVGNPDR